MFFESDETTAVLLTTRTAFEAETVAAALRHRGLAAQVVNTASAQVWAGLPVGEARVLVYQRDLDDAKDLLRTIRAEGAAVDWDATDIGQELDAEKPASRAAWTMVLVLVLLGLGVLSAGVSRRDPILQALGVCALITAAIVGRNAWAADSRRLDR